MDHLTRALIFALLWFWSDSSSANYAANPVPGSFCYANPANYGPCMNNVRFGDAGGAALYACQVKGTAGATEHVITELIQNPSGGPDGFNNYGKFAWGYSCTYKSLGNLYTQNGAVGIITAESDCTPQINNYYPATCSGDKPVGGGVGDPPVACVNTDGAVIPAYHPVPVSGTGCYAGCLYTSLNTSIVENNGGTYNAGTWTGNGTQCAPSEIALFGGAPGNPFNPAGGGIGPGDLLTIARETTLQSVLQAIQAGTTLHNSNQTILERIAAATEAANSGGSTTVDDPDGFEASYIAKSQAAQVDANGRLSDSALNAQTIDVGGTFSNVQGFIGASSCPAAPTFVMLGRTYSFDMTIICGLAQALSYLVVALASIAGVKIFVGGF